MAKNTVPLTATGQALVGQGTLNKVIVTASSSGVIKLVDAPNSAVGRVLLDNLSVSAGNILDLNLEYYEGVFVTLVSGTATIQLSYSL
jgi:hypothetical protein